MSCTPDSVDSLHLTSGLYALEFPRKQGVPLRTQAQDGQHPQGGRHSTQSARTDTMTPPHSPRSNDSLGSCTDDSAERADPDEWTNCCRVHSPGAGSSRRDNIRSNYGRRFLDYTSPTLHNNARPSVDSSGVGRGSGTVCGRRGGLDQCGSCAWAGQGSDTEHDEEEEGSRAAQPRKYIRAFDVDGFSSAEEETWRSEGEIKLRVTAISRANLHDGGNASVSDTDRTDLLVERRCGGGGGGMVTPTRWSPSVVMGSQCEMGKSGLEGSRGSGAAGVPRPEGRRCGARSLDIKGSSSSSSSSNRRQSRLSRPLFIEIEDKASEPPLVRPASGRYSKVHCRLGVSGGPGGKGAGATQDDSDGDNGALCGCVHRCIRRVEALYRAVSGTVKFSKIEQT